MSLSLEREQAELKAAIPTLTDELDEAQNRTEDLQKFIDKAKKITRLTELTPELVHEFVQKIVVSSPRYLDGKRHQIVDIYYNGVGIIREPTVEEMEEAFQEHLRHRKSKTA